MGGMMPSGDTAWPFGGKAMPRRPTGESTMALRVPGSRAPSSAMSLPATVLNLPVPVRLRVARHSIRERVEIMLTRRRAALADHRMARMPRDGGRPLRRLLLGATILGGAMPLAAQAQAVLPSGGSVVAGQAAIGQAGGTMAIRQSSDRAIIDWADFSIGEKAGVMIENGSGATLNRVTGGAVSSIDGLLRATGSVYLVNPNGVVIGARGVVETGGSFIASTLDLPDAAFLAGGSLTFTGTSRAKVVNLGKVGALGGNVALIGAVVENRGSLSATNGTMGLIAGSKVLLRDAAHDGGGLFSVLYGDAQTSAANGGAIAAANVELRAQQGNVYALAGNSAGTINATGVRRGDGKVWLVSDAGGTEVAGTIRARGAGGSAGGIETSGARLRIGASTIDAAGGTWLVDPEDLVVDAAAAATINAALGNNSGVTLTTGANGASAYGNGDANGAGDILINAGLSWNTGATLTLNAYHGIAINAPIAVNGAGSVVLRTNQGGTGGDIGFAPAGAISFADNQAGQALRINDVAYNLLYSWDELKAISGQGGTFALAHGLPNLNGTTAFVPVLNGVLDGLGNRIDGATIQPMNLANVGLIGTINGGAVARNLVLGKISIYDWTRNGSSQMGGLAGVNNGLIANIVAEASVMTGDGKQIGGLVGINRGEIRNVAVVGDTTGNDNVGGLVGQNFGSISGATLTSAIETWGARYVGGLVGVNEASGTITDSHASAPVVANEYYVGGTYQAGDFRPAPYAGGLVGRNLGTITRSFATGSVSGSSYVGGLVGSQERGTIDTAYATGAVTASTIAGGLVGASEAGTRISNVYATGSVTAEDGLGGLVGYTDAEISYAYASGTVTATSYTQFVGGFAGASGLENFTNSRWDTTTTRQNTAIGGGGVGRGVSRLSSEMAKSAAAYSGWDLDETGGQNKVWRIYEGATAPLLKAFLTPATVAFTGSTSASALYDGTNQSGRFQAIVQGVGGQAVDSAKIMGSLRYSCLGGANACVDAGVYAVQATGGLYSTQSGYDIAYSAATASLSITPRTLDVTANGATMVYGDGMPTLTYGLGGDGLVGNDRLSGALSTSAGANSAVGSYAIERGTLAASGNYALRFTGATLAVTPRSLTVTANDRSMVYGDGTPALTYALGGAGLVDGDMLSGALSTSAGATSAVGSHAIGQGTLSAGANYALHFTGGTLSITPRSLTVTANDRTMVYGDALPALTYALGGAGLVNGDTLSGALVTNASPGSAIGTYAIGLGGLSAGSNYALSFTGATLAVTPRPLTVTANDRSMVYGDTLPALTYALGGAGLTNGDTLSGALATNAAPTSAVGSYAIGQGTLAASSNYTLSFVGGQMAVTPRPLTVTADARSIVYGDALPTLGYSVDSGALVNGDTLRGALATRATATSGAGAYAIEQGTLAANSNYALNFAGATLSITPRALTVTADDRTMLYGEAVPALAYAVDAAGLVHGDTLEGTLRGALGTAASATSPVGTYAIGLGTLSAGSNYTIRFGGARLTVTPRPLSVTALDQTMVYGDGVPALTFGLGGAGLVNGDTLRGSLATSASGASPVGSYAIGQGTLSAGSNYALSFTGANLAVTPRPLIIRAQDSSKVLGTALDPSGMGFQAIGLVNGDRVEGVALWSEGFGAAAPYDPDPYAIAVSNASGAGLSNYAIVYQNAPTGLIVRDPNVRPTPLSIRLAGDGAPAGVARGADGALLGARTDGPIPMRPFPGIFYKRQN